MVRKLYIKEDAYPMDWKPSKDDIDRVFSALDQSKSKNPDFLNDNFGFSRYTVKFGDSRKTYISIYAAIDKDGYRVDETFYISPDEKMDTYKISTEELGERTVGKSTDVWDIISTCLRKQLKSNVRESFHRADMQDALRNMERDFGAIKRIVNTKITGTDDEFYSDFRKAASAIEVLYNKLATKYDSDRF